MDISEINDSHAVVICKRTSYGYPEVPAKKEKCDFCGEFVYLSDSTRKHAESQNLPGGLKLICLECSGKLPKDSTPVMPSDEQIKEIADKLGKPFDEVKKSMKKFINGIGATAKRENN